MSCSPYHAFINRIHCKIERLQVKIREAECLVNFHKNSIPTLISHRTQDFHVKRLVTCEKDLAKLRLSLESLQKLDPDVSGNGNNMAAAYIASLQSSEKNIVMSLEYTFLKKYSVTEMPDLSALSEVASIFLTGHIHLTSGMERIPKTVTNLALGNTGLSDVSILGELTQLENLQLHNCYKIRNLPDLSNLVKLNRAGLFCPNLEQIPKLPLNVKIMTLPITKGLLTTEEIEIYSKISARSNNVPLRWLDAVPPIWLDINEAHGAPIKDFIWKCNWINNFRQIREDIMRQAAAISMHPNRVARLLETEKMEFDQLEERDNLFNYQFKESKI